MRMGEARSLGILSACLLTGLAAMPREVPGPEAAPPGVSPRVRLAVLIVVDQLRADLLTRWEHLFGQRGFRRLGQEGAWFQNCHYPYASTFTGAGHASLATGCSPHRHGIIGNDWYVHREGQRVNCVAHPDSVLVPRTLTPDTKKVRAGSGPYYLRAETVADRLKEATRNRGKVVALSVKDRSAVLPGGQRPDACYWADAKSGLVVTSSVYRAREHPWVEKFNQARLADHWLGIPWERFRPDLDYDRFAGPDDREGEARGYEQGRTFPHTFAPRLGEKFYEGIANSPVGNRLLLELARKAIEAENLGQDDIPDFLSISFSSNDLIGHTWGPDSHEVLDVTLRTDDDLAGLFDYLDEKVGEGRYAVVLSADHGVSPTPETARLQGKQGQRVDTKNLTRRANDFLEQRFGAGKQRPIAGMANHDLYLHPGWIRARGLERPAVEEALAKWAAQQDGVLRAFTRTELLSGVLRDRLARQVWRSFYSERSGDVVVILQPYHMFGDPLAGGTTHGSPHPYDTHVPLMVHGPGVIRGVRQDRVTPQAAAPILAHFLGIDPPRDAEVTVPPKLFE